MTTPSASSTDTAGAERALERAKAEGWTVVSIAKDWNDVFSNYR
jgi:hypothetical protein